MPITASEAEGGKCPVCGAAVDASEAEVQAELAEANAPAPTPEPLQRSHRAAWVLLGGLVLFAGAWALVVHFNAPRPPKPEVLPPAAAAPVEPRPALPPELEGEPLTPKVRELAAKAAAAERREAPVSAIEQKEPLAPGPKMDVSGGEAKLTENADGSFTVSALDGKTRVKLSGQIGTLRVSKLDGTAMLDATKLKAQEVIFDGEVTGRAQAKIVSHGASVRMNGNLGGQSQVLVNAAEGTVIVGAEDGTAGRISENARLTVTAKNVTIGGTIDGEKTRVKVTLSSGGSLRFTELAGEARMEVRKGKKTDPEPRIDAGTIAPTAKYTPPK
jgi:hypothetical protein